MGLSDDEITTEFEPYTLLLKPLYMLHTPHYTHTHTTTYV